NQFYTKEFFVDRVFAGADTSAAQNRMRWIFQDFTKSDMNTFDSRSAAKKRDLVVANSKFMQCGVNKTTSGACSSIYGSVNPLNDIREKLVDGIRTSDRPDVLDIILHTFDDLEMRTHADVKDYIDDFRGIRNSIILSENSRDWLLTSTGDALTSSCEINP